MPADPSRMELVARARALSQAEVDASDIERMFRDEEARAERLRVHMEPFYREVERVVAELIKERHDR